jgi:magnesium chelatase family protein
MYGQFGDPTREYRCTPLQIQRYVNRILRPLLDRIDIYVDLPAVKFKELASSSAPEGESSAQIRERVVASASSRTSSTGSGDLSVARG